MLCTYLRQCSHSWPVVVLCVAASSCIDTRYVFWTMYDSSCGGTCTAVPGMGSSWESNIARLIDQANRTLSSSAHFRNHESGERTMATHRGNRQIRRSPSPLRSAVPTTFKSDRGGSYRPKSEGWDGSFLARERPSGGGTGGAFGDGLFFTSYPPPTASPAPYSRLAAARVDTARIDGMEERIKLEVQTVVRQDVNQRVSLSERAIEAIRQRMEGLSEELANLGKMIRQTNESTTTALEQLLAGEQRTRRCITVLEAWKEDREGWCARISDSLSSLDEDARALQRRTHTQQKVIDEAVTTQEDLAASIKSSRKVGEAASASAIAPIREHFLKEIEAIRRRLLALEGETHRVATTEVPNVTQAQAKSIAQDEASAKAEEVWENVKSYVRENAAEQAKDTCDADVAARQKIELHLAEVEQRVNSHDFTLKALQEEYRTNSRGGEALVVRGDVEALEKRLVENLAQINDELREMRSRENRYATSAPSEKVEKSALDEHCTREDLEPILKRLKELERLRDRRSSDDLAPTALGVSTSASVASVEEMEGIAKTVQALTSGAEVMRSRQAIFENSLEEVSDALNGHTLKLRSLEGLWRQTLSKDAEQSVSKATAGEGSERGSGCHNCSNSSGMAASEATPKSSTRGEEGRAVVPTAPSFRAGLGGLLKRLGSSALSSSQQEATSDCTDGGQGALSKSVGKIEDPESVPPSEPSEAKTSLGKGPGLDQVGLQLDVSDPTGSEVIDGRLSESTMDKGDTPSSSSIHETSPKDGRSLCESEGVGVTAATAATLPEVSSRQPQPTGRVNESGDAILQMQGPVDDRPAEMESAATDVADGAETISKAGAVSNRASVSTRRASASSASPAGQQGVKDLEESGGSLEEGSTHSRWSLPGNRGIGGIGAGGGLHEQRAVWAGGQDDDSMGTGERVLSSSGGEEGDRGDGKSSSRSRVESYDLQQEAGGDYMVPFSPARSETASPNDSSRKTPDRSTIGENAMTSEKGDTPVIAVVGGVADTSATATTAPTGTVTSSTGISTAVAHGDSRGGGVLLDGKPSTKGFDFSDDDESDEDELVSVGRNRTMRSNKRNNDDIQLSGAKPSVGKGENEREASGSGNTSAGEHCIAAIAKDIDAGTDGIREEARNRDGRSALSQCSEGDIDGDKSNYHSSSGNDDDRESGSADELRRHRSPQEDPVDLAGSPQGTPFDDDSDNGGDEASRTSHEGGQEGVADAAGAAPTLRGWAPPDFGFSSDDDFDIDLSASERSLEVPAELSLSRSTTPEIEE